MIPITLVFNSPVSRVQVGWSWRVTIELPKLGRLEKAMAPYSSTLAWKIPWTEEPGRLQSVGSLRVRHDFTFTFHFHTLEKEMATHSSVLAWRIPETGEPSGLPSMESHRVRHYWSDLAAAAANSPYKRGYVMLTLSSKPSPSSTWQVPG